MPATARKPKQGAAKSARDSRAQGSIPSRARGARRARHRATAAQPSDHQNEGHGRRLTAAFEALEAFPALAESRNRLLAVVAKEHVATADIVDRGRVGRGTDHRRAAPGQPRAGRPRGRVDTVVGAVELLSPQTVQALAAQRAHLRLLRARERLGRRSRALPAARAGDPARRRPRGGRGRLRVPRPPDRHEPAARHRQARADVRLPRLSLARCTAARARPRSASTRSAASSASTTRSSAACLPAAGGCPATIATVIERHHNPDAEGEAARRRAGRHARALRAGRPGVAGGDAPDRAHRRPRPQGAATRAVRAAELLQPAPAPRRSRARCPAASSACCSASPKARSTSRSPTS